VARARDTRMARLEAPAARADSVEILDRCALRARTKVRALVGDALARAGIEPGRAQALRLGEATESSPAEATPHPDPLPASEAREPFAGFAASDDDGLAGIFAAKMGDMARRYQDGSEPDVTTASLAELFAWCLARPAQGSPAPGISSA
jgi:hypothetical protein